MVWRLATTIIVFCCAGSVSHQQDAQCSVDAGGGQCDIQDAAGTLLLQVKQLRRDSNPFPDVCKDACSVEFVKNQSEVAPVTLVTVAYNLSPPEIAWLRENRKKLARAFGYENCMYTSADCFPPRPGGGDAPAWAKIGAVTSLLAQGRKIVAVMDGDAVIVNPQPFHPIIEPYFSAGKSIVFSQDCHNRGLWGGPEVRGGLNTGVFVTRSDSWALAFWSWLWEKPISRDNGTWWEQGAILRYMAEFPEDFDRHAVRVGTHVMNSCNGSYRQGDFMYHAYDLYGMSFKERLAYMMERFGS